MAGNRREYESFTTTALGDGSSQPSVVEMFQITQQGYSTATHHRLRRFPQETEGGAVWWVAIKRTAENDGEESDDEWYEPTVTDPMAQLSDDDREVLEEMSHCEVLLDGDKSTISELMNVKLTADEVDTLVYLAKKFNRTATPRQDSPGTEKMLVANSLAEDFTLSRGAQEEIFTEIFKQDIKISNFVGKYPYARTKTQRQEKVRSDGKIPRDWQKIAAPAQDQEERDSRAAAKDKVKQAAQRLGHLPADGQN